MKPHPPLVVDARPSRAVIATIVTGYGLTAALVVGLPLSPGVAIALAGSVVVAAAIAVWRIGGAPAPARLQVGIDRSIVVTTRNGRRHCGYVLADTFVGERLVGIVWRRDGARIACTLLVAADALPADDLRRLRVVLRYSRAPAPRPASSDSDAG